MSDDTPFHKALRWRVHDPDEALWIAASHRRQAAEARARMPDPDDSFRTWSVRRGLEQRAMSHDEIAVVCERHAAALVEGRSRLTQSSG